MKSAEHNPTDNVEQTMTSLVRRLFEHTRGKQGHKAETETGKTIFEWHCGISSEPGRPAQPTMPANNGTYVRPIIAIAFFVGLGY